MLFKVIYVTGIIISLFFPPSLPFIVHIPSVASFEGYILREADTLLFTGGCPFWEGPLLWADPLAWPQLLLKSEKQFCLTPSPSVPLPLPRPLPLPPLPLHPLVPSIFVCAPSSSLHFHSLRLLLTKKPHTGEHRKLFSNQSKCLRARMLSQSSWPTL